MGNTEGESKTEETITFSKSKLYIVAIGVLVILLIASIFSGGFGISKPASSPSSTNIIPNPNSAPTPSVRTQETSPQALAGGGISINSLIDDDMKLGSDSAPVVVIEFSDFECPFCRKWWRESLSSLENEYVKTGKVQFVYRDFPLNFHPGAQPAAEAAECARDQGKWREMHDKIFSEQDKQGQGTIQFSAQDVKNWGSQIDGLDDEKFIECLNSGKYTQEVQKDFADGTNIGVGGTPTFVIGKRGGTGQLLVGAQPYSVMKQAIESLLS